MPCCGDVQNFPRHFSVFLPEGSLRLLPPLPPVPVFPAAALPEGPAPRSSLLSDSGVLFQAYTEKDALWNRRPDTGTLPLTPVPENLPEHLKRSFVSARKRHFFLQIPGWPPDRQDVFFLSSAFVFCILSPFVLLWKIPFPANRNLSVLPAIKQDFSPTVQAAVSVPATLPAVFQVALFLL